MAGRNKGSVEGLKDKLYSRQEGELVDPGDRTPLSSIEPAPIPGWAETAQDVHAALPPIAMIQRKKNTGMSFGLKFLTGSVAFFCVAAGVAAYLFFTGTNNISPQNIDLTVVMPSVIDGGKETPIQILINNRNQANLKLVDLVINYPAGTRDPNAPQNPLLHERQSIGDISSGGQQKRTSQAIFYGQEGQSEQVSVQLQYSVEGSNAIFEKDASATFTVGSSPVSISTAAPSESISGQPFDMDITVQSNALDVLDNVVVQGQYPFGFSVVSSSPQAVAGGTFWRVGSLKPGESKVLHVSGTLNGQDGDTRVFYFLAGSNSDVTDTRIPVPFLSVPQTLTVRQAFITAQIAVNSKTGKTVAVPVGATVQGTVTWTNNLPDPVSDVQLRLSLKGPMVDTRSITAQTGFYNSIDGTIVWSKDREHSLEIVAPGGTGTLPFSFSLLPTGSGGTVYANPAIDLNLTVEGTRQGQTGVPEQVSSAASTQVVLSSVVALTAKSAHFSGPFANTGPMPPVPGQPTTYTVTWTVTNSSNTIANGVVTATLPTYMKWVAADQGSGLTYEAKSRTITWSLGDIKAGTGYTLGGRSATFQVSLLPSTSQIGQAPALTGSAVLSGQDRFAQVQVNATADAPTTQLANDGAGYTSLMGVVAQ